MPKLNKYVEFVNDDERTIVFNLQNEALMVLSAEVAKLLQENMLNVDVLHDVHPELYAQLEQVGIIVPTEMDETRNMVEAWKRADSNPASFGLIINPTLGCNMRCWYCYEAHEQKPLMSSNVLQSIERLIEKKTTSPELRALAVSFFGGEPLLGFEKVVKPLLTLSAKLCAERGIKLQSNFTTNATLLTPDKLDFLEVVGLSRPATFQISLDGNRAMHDQTRIGTSREPTYDIILGHLVEAARRGHQVNVRLNYTTDNLLTFADVASEFGAMPDEVKANIRFNFQRIWQDHNEGIDLAPRIEDLRKIFEEEGFTIQTDIICHRHCCYADCENNAVVNYDGRLFKCTARDFKPEICEGELTEEGDIVWNERFHQRMALKYSNTACLACRILPLCNGGCSQHKVEATTNDECLLHLSEEDKELRILGRLKQLLRNV